MCESALTGAGGSGAGTPELFPIDSAFHGAYNRAYEELAGRGERLLACAMLPLDGDIYPEDFEFADDNFPQDGERAGISSLLYALRFEQFSTMRLYFARLLSLDFLFFSFPFFFADGSYGGFSIPLCARKERLKSRQSRICVLHRMKVLRRSCSTT